MEIYCTLCSEPAHVFTIVKNNKYYTCSNCRAVLLDPQQYLSPDEERNRYLHHDNDVNDIRYQEFVKPIVEEIKRSFTIHHTGLDFGAGTGPVISKLLREAGYSISLYDPFFWNAPEMLELTYDYIACCEVIEHFKNPASEFKLLRSLLNKNGSLLCKTSIFSPEINFGKWYYKDDQTHVFFYRRDTLHWIKEHYNFSSLTITDQLILYTV